MVAIGVATARSRAKEMAKEHRLRSSTGRSPQQFRDRSNPPAPSRHGKAEARVRSASIRSLGAQGFAHKKDRDAEGRIVARKRVRAARRTGQPHGDRVRRAFSQAAINSDNGRGDPE